ncbi:MAG: TonB-dependent receptor [Massilibacteroides sp.]|nr:TonB-dependent receptor [Massilibacteroides sp.]MDD3061237.1 TonB-dependent receptor [Massilibacteroides sp.]MDD4115678.1 TonB-dependent receptor [Massilibacteroides sp.]MDD4661294.1 TonB-dependent receptor [Massilibacteroides sp.]
MKIISALLLVNILTVSATAYSQEEKVSISINDKTVKEVFSEIKAQTDYSFWYDTQDVNEDEHVSINAKEKKVNYVLSEILKNQDVDFTLVGNHIVIARKGLLNATIEKQQAKKQKIVKGLVTDEYGEPIIGANIIEKGSNNGTITDIDGAFSLSIDEGSLLYVSYIGYISQEISTRNASTINIQLKENTKALDEVVVVGFGTQKKINLSGSVASIDMDKLSESRPITNISSALAGTTAGLQVSSTSNRPGDDNATILIRGKGTLNNAAPLVIIDGMEGDISSVNVQDVDNISVLKDASSAAIYGSRAANGVILITTKTGKAGSLKVAYNGYVSFQTIRPNVLASVSNYANYMDLMNEAYTNSAQLAIFSEETINAWRNDNGQNPLMYPNTNWINEAFSTGVGTNHNVSMSGGSEKIQFYGAFGYFDNPGILENAGYSKYNARVNINAQLTDWLSMGMNVSGYVGNAEPGNAGQSATEAGEAASVGAFTWGWATTPAMILKHDGRYGGIQNSEDDISESGNNILLALNSTKGNNTTRNVKPRFYISIEPLKGLSITGSYSYEYTNQGIKTMPVFNDTWNFGTEQIITKGEGQTYITQKDYKRERNYMDAVAKYNTKLVDERLDIGAMIGASQEQYHYEWMSAQRKDLTSSQLSVFDAATGEVSVTGNQTAWAMRSFFGRINFGWDNKYLIEFNLRRDGSSRFQSDNRWGYFPSGSVAWRINQEDFMKNISWLDNLKVRASYGTLGNNAVGNYASVSRYSFANYVLGNNVATGLAMTNLANANLKWEKTQVVDLGIDFSLLNNRLYGTFDYFNKKTKDILIDLPAPAVHGTSSVPTSNSAQVSNKGVELTLGWRDKVGDVSYEINANYTYVKNNVDKFKGDEYSLSGVYMIKEGLPINSIYTYVKDRIIQTDADLAIVNQMIDKNPDAFKAIGAVPEKGDILFKDLNNDGFIDTKDRDVVGNTVPKHMFGLNLSAGYLGIDFSIFMQGIVGVDGYLNESYFTSNVTKGYQLSKEITDNCWREGVTDALYPKLTRMNVINTTSNSLWVQNKGFLKIRNIQLGYTLPRSWFDKLSVSKCRVYGSLENFFTFTKYKGIDPELDNLSYPTMRQAVIGVNIEF